jgi:hypothetical protein
MRHSWKEISRNVALCCRCGLKRIVEKQAGPWRTSIPDVSYRKFCVDGKIDRLKIAGHCNTQWPPEYEPAWRAILYKEPLQKELL